MRAFLFALAVLAGCSKSSSGDEASLADAGVDAQAGSDATTTPEAGAEYPPPPYGLTVGSTFPRLLLDGYAPSRTPFRTIDMAEYYDPTGVRGVTAIYLSVAAVWCGPCQKEAELLAGPAGLYEKKYRALGASFLSVFTEDRDYQPATRSTLDAWIAKYSVTYDTAVLKAGVSSKTILPDGTGIPLNFTIDPRDMKIRVREASVTSPDSLAALDRVIADNTSKVDAGGKNDSSTGLCGLAPTAACAPFDPTKLPTPSTACTTADVRGLVAACYDGTTASADACADWTTGAKSMTACGTCIGRWLTKDGTPDSLACQYMFLGGSDPTQQAKCRNAVSCMYACYDGACNKTVCDDAAEDSLGKTELDRCYNLGSLSDACRAKTSDGAAIGTTYTACTTDSAFRTATANCRPSSSSSTPIATQIEYFFRGACRDNGSWLNATSGGDGG